MGLLRKHIPVLPRLGGLELASPQGKVFCFVNSELQLAMEDKPC